MVIGLDARVYCDCYETGKLREPPPDPSIVVLSPDGSLDCRDVSLRDDFAFDEWRHDRACEHENGVLVHHYLGNIARVSGLYDELQSEREKFPVLLDKVLYSGTHTGDWIERDGIPALMEELQTLDRFIASDEERQVLIDQFISQMRELADVALKVGKPIAF